jgi:uncharacterized membrane protein YphA (DoxX/SURF4 family)
MLRPQSEPYVGTVDRAGRIRPAGNVAAAPRSLGASVDRVEARVHEWLVAHSVLLLRLSLGVVFLLFGALKLLGVSPAANLVEATTAILGLGLVPGPVALVAVGVLECVIGLALISGQAMRPTMYLLGVQLVGILSPLVLLAPRLFSGPHNAPTLEGQYVIKDLILVGAALVVATTVRGGRLTSAPEPG